MSFPGSLSTKVELRSLKNVLAARKEKIIREMVSKSKFDLRMGSSKKIARMLSATMTNSNSLKKVTDLWYVSE